MSVEGLVKRCGRLSSHETYSSPQYMDKSFQPHISQDRDLPGCEKNAHVFNKKIVGRGGKFCTAYFNLLSVVL